MKRQTRDRIKRKKKSAQGGKYFILEPSNIPRLDYLHKATNQNIGKIINAGIESLYIYHKGGQNVR